MKTVYIGLGSNLGNRFENLSQALNKLAELDQTKLLCVSSVYESQPIDFSNQAYFLNAVCKIQTDLPPRQLLISLKGIERTIGRPEQYERWSPRCIDLDILFFGNEALNTPDLTFPHSEIPNRKFVLIPLLEIEDLLHPTLNKLISELLNSTKDLTVVCKYNALLI